MKNNLDLATAFAFMACDGEIAPGEVALIRDLAEKGLIECDNIDENLDLLLKSLNEKGLGFMRDYFSAIEEAAPDAATALRLLKIAVATIMADEVVDYCEVKFFRAVRSHLHSVTDSEILDACPEVEDFWLAADVRSAGADFHDREYLSSVTIPTFDEATVKGK